MRIQDFIPLGLLAGAVLGFFATNPENPPESKSEGKSEGEATSIIVVKDWQDFRAEIHAAGDDGVKLQAMQKKWTGKRVAFEAYIVQTVPHEDGGGLYRVTPTRDIKSYDRATVIMRKGFFDVALPPNSHGVFVATISSISPLGEIYTDAEAWTLDADLNNVPLTHKTAEKLPPPAPYPIDEDNPPPKASKGN